PDKRHLEDVLNHIDARQILQDPYLIHSAIFASWLDILERVFWTLQEQVEGYEKGLKQGQKHLQARYFDNNTAHSLATDIIQHGYECSAVTCSVLDAIILDHAEKIPDGNRSFRFT